MYFSSRSEISQEKQPCMCMVKAMYTASLARTRYMGMHVVLYVLVMTANVSV